MSDPKATPTAQFATGDIVTIGSAKTLWRVEESWHGGSGEEFISLASVNGYAHTSIPAVRLRLVTT